MSDEVVASSTTATATETVAAPAEPTYTERVDKLSPPERDEWKLTGDLEAIEAKRASKNSDVTSDSSPAKSAATEKPAETAPGSDHGDTEEPPKGRNRTNWVETRKTIARLEGQVELLTRQLAERGNGSAQEVQQHEAAEESFPGMPVLEDYDTVSDWQKDFAKAVLKHVESTFSQRSVQQTETQREAAWEETLKQATVKYPDFEKVALADDVPSSDAIERVAKGHKSAVDVLYFLGKPENRAVVERLAEKTDIPNLDQLAKSNPARAAYMIGKAETVAQLEFDRIAEQITKPSASKPNKPALSKPTSEVTVSTQKASEALTADPIQDAISRGDVNAYIRLMNEQEARERGQR